MVGEHYALPSELLYNRKAGDIMPLADYLRKQDLKNYVSQDYSFYDDDAEAKKLINSNLNGIFGIPYQFLSTADRRIDGTDIGRKYGEKIMARLPLLFLTPGKQVFMEDFSKEDKKSVLNYIGGKIQGVSDGDVSELISGKGRYYSFQFDYDTYYNYVNAMAHSVAYYMGIGETEVAIASNNRRKLGKFDWRKAVADEFKSFFDAKENVVFYLDGMTQISESFSNSTTEPSLASTINGYSDTAKEIQFLLGGEKSVVSTLVDGMKGASDSILGGLSGIIGKFGGGILQSLATSGVSSVLEGGKIIFPEIWQDSTYDRSYSLDIKLRSPDHDSLSIYLNIIIPYIHLLALCLPRSIEEDPNAYTSPFLVKAFCKGMFNIDMGMITSMNVTKGAECCWNDDGLPTQIDISLDIKDLYSSLYMTGYAGAGTGILTNARAIKLITQNTAMMDYLANMSGLNLAQMEMGRRTGLYLNLMGANIRNLPSRAWSRFDQSISNLMGRLYKII